MISLLVCQAWFTRLKMADEQARETTSGDEIRCRAMDRRLQLMCCAFLPSVVLISGIEEKSRQGSDRSRQGWNREAWIAYVISD